MLSMVSTDETEIKINMIQLDTQWSHNVMYVRKSTENRFDVLKARFPCRPKTLNITASSVVNKYCIERRTHSSKVRPPISPITIT